MYLNEDLSHEKRETSMRKEGDSQMLIKVSSSDFDQTVKMVFFNLNAIPKLLLTKTDPGHLSHKALN